jgi:DNA-binding transcriptional regulator YiaG
LDTNKFWLAMHSSQGYILTMTPEQIKRLMKRLGFSQQQLADAIGAHRVTIADWTRGASKPTGLYLKALEGLAAKAKRNK